MADLANHYPAISDIKARAKRRIPHVAWVYLTSGTGPEKLVDANHAVLDAVRLMPRFMVGPCDPDLRTSLFGHEFEAPFGLAPVGGTGLIWPEGECMLARMAARHAIPYTLSTVACETPETIGPLTGGRGWFQLYSPKTRSIRDDILDRAKDAGFSTLLVTADVPVPSVRERQRKAGLSDPPRTDLRMLASVMARPAWARATAKRGAPRFRTLAKYTSDASVGGLGRSFGEEMIDCLDWDYFAEIRAHWKGPLVLKGLLHPSDARKAVDLGADGIVVSNHGGRQLDAAPTPVAALPAILEAVGGQAAVLFDSGVRDGHDVARAIALGADFVLLGRAFLYGLAAFGEAGADHVATLLKAELSNVMKQLGVERLTDLPATLCAPDGMG